MCTFGLKDKTIVVTGAGGFLGGFIRQALLSDGANVIGIDIKTSETAQALDITNSDAVDNFIELHKDLELDGLINNAAINIKGYNIPDESFRKTLDVNITGTYNCISKFSTLMKDGSSIVNVASIYGFLSPDSRIYDDNKDEYSSSAYGITKGAILQMTRYYATHLAPIRVNSISPGGIFNAHDKSFTDAYSKRVPLKRMAQPNEIADAMLFLLSNRSSYITGHNLVVDGGLSAW
jgi:NAD(P)-dependent dehydrogenase (short-subunit alcohol dehydrogenase family)